MKIIIIITNNLSGKVVGHMLCPKVLLANQIGGFLKVLFLTIEGRCKIDFLYISNEHREGRLSMPFKQQYVFFLLKQLTHLHIEINKMLRNEKLTTARLTTNKIRYNKLHHMKVKAI